METELKGPVRGRQLLFDRKALLLLIIPLVLEQLLNFTVGLADNVMVASVGEAAVSAVSLVDNVFILILQVMAALSTGGAVIVGQYLGQKKGKDAARTGAQTAVFLLIFSVAVMCLLYIGQEFILRKIFGDISEDVYGYAKTYLLICAWSVPFTGLHFALAAVMRAHGDARTPLLVSLLMNIINCGGNAILIYGFGCGTEGVAYPTSVAHLVACGVILWLTLRKKNKKFIDFDGKIKIEGGLFKRIMTIAIPGGVENSLFQIGKLIVLNLIATFGTSAIAANAVGMSVTNFLILPGFAMCSAIVTVLSQCVGAGDEWQFRYYMKKLMIIIYISMFAVAILIYFCLPGIFKLYGLTDATNAAARTIIVSHAIADVIIWPLSFCIPNAFRSRGNAMFPMVVSIASMILVRLVFSYIFANQFGLGVVGTWYAMYLDWAVRSVIFVTYYFIDRKKRIVNCLS